MKHSTILPTVIAVSLTLSFGLGSLHFLGRSDKIGSVASVQGASTSRTTLTVGRSGAEYTTVQAAINAVPTGTAVASYAIKIAAGTYHEVIKVPSDKPGLTTEGATGTPRMSSSRTATRPGHRTGAAAPSVSIAAPPRRSMRQISR